MENNYLPERDMLPRIEKARYFDTKKYNITGRTRERVLDTFEISLFIADGGIIVENGNTHTVHKGDVRFTRPGDHIWGVPDYQCCTVYFKLSYDSAATQNEFLNGIPSFFQSDGREQAIFQQIIDHYLSTEPGDILMQNALLLQLLYSYYSAFHSPSRFCVAVQTAIEYMREHVSEKITLDTLGEITGYSPLHVLRLFRADTGHSPHEYLESLRMTRARTLLSETSTPVSKLALECGFSSESHFHSLFKKANGVTPGDYRKITNLL